MRVKYLLQPCAVADEYAKYFQSRYNTPCPVVFSTILSSSEFLSLATVSDWDILKAIKRLKPSKSVGVDDIPGFIIKGFVDIFVPVIKHTFNLRLSQPYRSKRKLFLFSKKATMLVLKITFPYQFLIIFCGFK
jgi:hypothetical protein